MNGFSEKGLDDSAFGEKAGVGHGLRTFDAFPKTKATYVRRTTSGGYTTIILIVLSTILAFTELRTWWAGSEAQTFSVEKGVSHTMQINLDTVIAMSCSDLHINVQDASGDRVLAGEILERTPTSWAQWVSSTSNILHQSKGSDRQTREVAEEEDTHVGHVLGEVRKGSKKFKKTPKIPRGSPVDACRIFGSLEGNKVQGDFHITARGHGYASMGGHVDHTAFNFTHIISELSFGPLYPSILNPLDKTLATTEKNFKQFQYFLSIVPTLYTRSTSPFRRSKTTSSSQSLPSSSIKLSKNTILTNQYAVTSQKRDVAESDIPGIFFKFDIEPILLTISETRGGFIALLVKVVNVVSGILVGGGWMYQLWDWARENLSKGGRRRARSSAGGMLHGRAELGYDEEEEEE